MSDLLTTLQIVRLILDRKVFTTADLMGQFDISERTLKRRIAHARDLGVELLSVRSGSGYSWYIPEPNARQIRSSGILDRWIELETEQTLLPQRQLSF